MADMGLKKIETGVDVLVSFLKGKGLMDLSKIAKELNTPAEIIQSWADFLVEEKVIGIEYKFTKPYLYFIEKKKENYTKTDEELIKYRKQFEDVAKTKNVPGNKTSFLWKNHLGQKLEEKKAYFFNQAINRKLDKVDLLWEEYKKRVMGL